jgi:hypothetical protein
MMILQVNTIKWYVMKLLQITTKVPRLLRIPPELGWYRRPTIRTYDFPPVYHWYMWPHERLHFLPRYDVDSICLIDGPTAA